MTDMEEYHRRVYLDIMQYYETLSILTLNPLKPFNYDNKNYIDSSPSLRQRYIKILTDFKNNRCDYEK